MRMGYTINDLCLMPVCLVPFGGLSEIDVRPGEVIIIAPATGRYGGVAVLVALAMGATVIAAGRNAAALENLVKIHSTARLRTVRLTEDASRNTELFREAAGTSKGVDAYIDFSPPAACGSTLFPAAVGALRPFGRCALMGGMPGTIEIPYLDVMLKSLRIQGRFMYGRLHIQRMVQMMESGLLPLGKKAGIHHTEEYGLEAINDALDAAGKLTGWGRHVVLKP
ncbi:uncharacterized protein N7459_001521 [Penicillium hispanicum]|uniref:uncharacterized protein n=1 Tax=Penicillium hispanicum TaxID=1080232 RepID=UPI00254204E7|nr:uncharacterized protein N7459_001521 [Penicillium hispanicum]KAJ5595313.1 hypothetical protein N7459_001521 [Penicillium hispanicum]